MEILTNTAAWIIAHPVWPVFGGLMVLFIGACVWRSTKLKGKNDMKILSTIAWYSAASLAVAIGAIVIIIASPFLYFTSNKPSPR